MIRVGTVGGAAPVMVDESGVVSGGHGSLSWWVGADDHWHVPRDAPGRRQSRQGPGPVIETVVRVPGGEASQRVYGIAGPDATVIEVENGSPAPFALALAVRTAGLVALDGNALTIDGRCVMTLPRPPLYWATSTDGSARDIVFGGDASTGPFVAVAGTDVEAVLCFPVAHQTKLRVALGATPVDLIGCPAPNDVAAGWETMLDRGMRTDLPEPLQGEIDAARADLLLASPSASVFVALEGWGFDAEAASAWEHLGLRDRRRARRRRFDATLLDTVRAELIHEHPDGVDILPGFRRSWLGRDLAVHGIPLPAGLLSFAVRWHGSRPALLWDAPTDTSLRVPSLDRDWSAPGGVGECLLAEPPAQLMAMGEAGSAGTPIADPEVFS